MDVNKVKETGIKAVLACLAGGGASGIAAAMDPSKYHFPQDFGSGKLWPFFFGGVGATALGMFLQSTFGKNLMAALKMSQANLAQNQAAIAQTKQEVKETLTKAEVDKNNQAVKSSPIPPTPKK
jgi:hypothetical protein